jgi:site-specific recombinase XerD
MFKINGLPEMAGYFKSSVCDSTFRNYRRGLADFARLLQNLKISVKSIRDDNTAIKATARVFHSAIEAGWNGARMRMMRTATGRLFSIIFGTSFTENALIRTILQSQVIKDPPRRERLSLSWKLEDLLTFLRSKPPPPVCSFSELTTICIVHLMVFKGMRFAEIHRLSPTETLPSSDEWKFWVVIKNHRNREVISIFNSGDEHLNTLPMLIELRDRIQSKIGEDIKKYNTFWFTEVEEELHPMSYNEVRKAAAEVLKKAGIKEHQPYHIKHATLTFLSQQGVPPAEITAFARHNYGSMAANAFYTSWDNGRALTKMIAKAHSNTESLWVLPGVLVSQLDIQI